MELMTEYREPSLSPPPFPALQAVEKVLDLVDDLPPEAGGDKEPEALASQSALAVGRGFVVALLMEFVMENPTLLLALLAVVAVYCGNGVDSDGVDGGTRRKVQEAAGGIK